MLKKFAAIPFSSIVDVLFFAFQVPKIYSLNWVL